MKRAIPLLVVMAMGTAACGGDATTLTTAGLSTSAPTVTTAPPETTLPAETTAPPTTEAATTVPAPTTTEPATTTTVAATTTTTEPSGGPFMVDEASFFPDPLPGSDHAHGSGCVIGDATVLPDGIWFGFADAVASGQITFDLACFWTGAEAEARAAADGEEAFDFYIRNKNPRTFAVPISGSARAWWIDASGSDFFPTEIPVTSWPRPGSWLGCPSEYCAVWLYVNGGQATGIVEQYLP